MASLASTYEPQWTRCVMKIFNEMNEFQSFKDILPIIGSYIKKAQRLLIRYKTGHKTMNHYGDFQDRSLMAVTISSLQSSIPSSTPPFPMTNSAVGGPTSSSNASFTELITPTTTTKVKEVTCKIVDTWSHEYTLGRGHLMMKDHIFYFLAGSLSSSDNSPRFMTWNTNINELTIDDAPLLKGLSDCCSTVIDHYLIWFGKSTSFFIVQIITKTLPFPLPFWVGVAVLVGVYPIVSTGTTKVKVDEQHYHQRGIAYNTRTKEWLSTAEHIIPSLPTLDIPTSSSSSSNNNKNNNNPLADESMTPISCMTTNGLWIRKFKNETLYHCYNTRTHLHSIIKPIHSTNDSNDDNKSKENQQRVSPKYMLPLSNGNVLLGFHEPAGGEAFMALSFGVLNPMNGEVIPLPSKLPFNSERYDEEPIIMDQMTTCSNDHGDNKADNGSGYDQQLLILPTRHLSHGWSNAFQSWLAVISFTRNDTTNNSTNVTIGEWHQLDISLPANHSLVGLCGVMSV
jgi:hypothetical protein